MIGAMRKASPKGATRLVAQVFAVLCGGMKWFGLILFLAVAACGGSKPEAPPNVPLYPNETPHLRNLIETAATDNFS